MAVSPRRLSLSAARRIALAAQGFGGDRAGEVGVRELARTVRRLGVVQVDSVNVLARAHYLPLFSRLGPYDRGLLDRMRDRAPRTIVEYWGHEASLIPVETWPLLQFRRDATHERAWRGIREFGRTRTDLVREVRDEVLAGRPLTARQCADRLAHVVRVRDDHWGWNWSEVKTALEFLFWSGDISSAGRNAQFERLYAAPEKVVGEHRATRVELTVAEQQLELVRIAARAHGIGTTRCLADYFRLTMAETRPAIDRLVSEGELEEVEVPGWAGPVYLHAGARRPRSLHAEALVAPFDPLVWERRRTEELFGMRYRIGIYTPAAQRKHGYYVLPFVYGDELVARVDLKADRAAGVLRVPQCTWEPGAPSSAVEALERQLESMAHWLDLGGVQHAREER